MSVLDRDIQATGLYPKKEIRREQILFGIEVIRPLFDKHIELEPCELTALHGYINGNEPDDAADADLRWDIVQSKYRSEQGMAVDDRHLGLFVIRKMLQNVNLDITNTGDEVISLD